MRHSFTLLACAVGSRNNLKLSEDSRAGMFVYTEGGHRPHFDQVHFHEQSYLDAFPKGDIVYLSSESENVLTGINPVAGMAYLAL